MKLTLIGVLIVFVLGLIFYLKGDNIEGFSSSACPTLVIKKDGAYYLQFKKSRHIKFNSLNDYARFVEWMRSQGLRCPILYLQETSDAQGSTSYRMLPDPRNPEGGLSVEQFPEAEGELKRKLTDASRLSTIFNRGLYPGYDPTNQDIGVETPLDKIFTSSGPISDNPMDPNWGGVDYSRAVVKSGKYEEDNVKIWVA